MFMNTRSKRLNFAMSLTVETVGERAAVTLPLRDSCVLVFYNTRIKCLRTVLTQYAESKRFRPVHIN